MSDLMLLPVPGDRVTCGNRLDLPKKQRRHNRISLGIDVRHMGDGSYEDVEVFACIVCGRDSYHRQK